MKQTTPHHVRYDTKPLHHVLNENEFMPIYSTKPTLKEAITHHLFMEKTIYSKELLKAGTGGRVLLNKIL